MIGEPGSLPGATARLSCH